MSPLPGEPAVTVTPDGGFGPLREMVGNGVPVAVTAKLPATPTEKVVLFALVILGDPGCSGTIPPAPKLGERRNKAAEAERNRVTKI